MGTLAFDRLRVRRLADEVEHLCADVVRLPRDVLATDVATAELRRLTRSVQPWVERLRSIAACAALEDYRPVTLPSLPLAQAHLLPLPGATWSLTTDPVHDSVHWPDAAGPLGRLLAAAWRRDDPPRLDDDTVRTLRAQLEQIATDSHASVDLLAGLGPDGLIHLVDALGARFHDLADDLAHHPEHPPTARDETERCLGLLGVIATAGAHRADLQRLAAAADPLAAAVVLAGSQLGGPALGRAADEVLRRWSAVDGWWLDRRTLDTSPLDQLVPALEHDHGAAGVLLDRLLARDDLAVLLAGGSRGDELLMVAGLATDPDRTPERRAGERLLGVLGWLRTEPLWSPSLSMATTTDPELLPRWATVRATLGEVVAPWQLHLSGLAPRWGQRPDEAVDQLVWVADDARAAAALAVGLAPAIGRWSLDLPADGAERRRRLDAVAASIGASAEVLRDARTDEWAERASRIATVTSLLDRLPITPDPVTKAVKSTALRAAAQWLAGDGDAEADAAIAEEQDRLAAMADLLVLAAWVDGVRRGDLDPTVPLDEQPTALRLELQHVRDAVHNPASRGDAWAAAADN